MKLDIVRLNFIKILFHAKAPSSQSFKSINSKKDIDSNQNKKHAPRMLGLNESPLFFVFIPLRALRLSERKNI